MQNKRISVVIPCFNEAKTIYQNIKKISGYLSSRFLEYEIIAVNDGSRDNTSAEICRAKSDFTGIVIIDNAVNFGKGKAVRDGIMAGRWEIVMFLDADLAIPIEELDKFIKEIQPGYDLAIASRFVTGFKLIKPVLWHRKIMERIFRILRRIIINNYAVQDTQCGFKVFSRRAARDIFSVALINRFAFDAEIIFIAMKKGYQIKELPIALQNPAVSSVRIYRDSVNMLMDLIRIRINSFLGKY